VWLVDGGPARFPCCRNATDEELADQPDLFDCSQCAVARAEALWPENREVWSIYQTLCGRTVSTLDLGGWLLPQLTEGWSLDQRLDLLARLDLILSLTAPKTDTDDGRRDHARHPD
jgi:hypothetical protein